MLLHFHLDRLRSFRFRVVDLLKLVDVFDDRCRDPGVLEILNVARLDQPDRFLSEMLP